ncbi:MAG: cysteine dioxygenase [Actinophytocola sp.]|nr:cysteine dioxygenase [Actinophytocola sp.]
MPSVVPIPATSWKESPVSTSAITASGVPSASRADILPARDAVAIADVDTGVSLDNLPGRDLSKQELRSLAADIASKPESWDQQLAFDDNDRHFVSLHRDAHVDIWLLCWTPSNDTGWHDHDISSGAVAVPRGVLIEHNLAVGATGVETAVAAGRVFCFGPEHIHRLTGGEHGTVSIHAYSPPLWRMGQYAVTKAGVLKRVSVSYADELRPLDEVPEVESSRHPRA